MQIAQAEFLEAAAAPPVRRRFQDPPPTKAVPRLLPQIETVQGPEYLGGRPDYVRRVMEASTIRIGSSSSASRAAATQASTRRGRTAARRTLRWLRGRGEENGGGGGGEGGEGTAEGRPAPQAPAWHLATIELETEGTFRDAGDSGYIGGGWSLTDLRTKKQMASAVKPGCASPSTPPLPRRPRRRRRRKFPAGSACKYWCSASRGRTSLQIQGFETALRKVPPNGSGRRDGALARPKRNAATAVARFPAHLETGAPTASQKRSTRCDAEEALRKTGRARAVLAGARRRH